MLIIVLSNKPKTRNMEVNFFSGYDTYGTPIEVGVRKDGKQFYRAYTRNRYGVGWTKWELLDGSRDVFEEHDNVYLKWGWNKLKGCNNPRIRLPKQ